MGRKKTACALSHTQTHTHTHTIVTLTNYLYSSYKLVIHWLINWLIKIVDNRGNYPKY